MKKKLIIGIFALMVFNVLGIALAGPVDDLRHSSHDTNLDNEVRAYTIKLIDETINYLKEYGYKNISEDDFKFSAVGRGNRVEILITLKDQNKVKIPLFGWDDGIMAKGAIKKFYYTTEQSFAPVKKNDEASEEIKEKGSTAKQKPQEILAEKRAAMEAKIASRVSEVNIGGDLNKEGVLAEMAGRKTVAAAQEKKEEEKPEKTNTKSFRIAGLVISILLLFLFGYISNILFYAFQIFFSALIFLSGFLIILPFGIAISLGVGMSAQARFIIIMNVILTAFLIVVFCPFAMRRRIWGENRNIAQRRCAIFCGLLLFQPLFFFFGNLYFLAFWTLGLFILPMVSYAFTPTEFVELETRADNTSSASLIPDSGGDIIPESEGARELIVSPRFRRSRPTSGPTLEFIERQTLIEAELREENERLREQIAQLEKNRTENKSEERDSLQDSPQCPPQRRLKKFHPI